MGPLILLTILGSDIWVFIDARLIEHRSGPIGKTTSWWGWGIFCLLVWVIGFPAYLYYRHQHLTGSGKVPAGFDLDASLAASETGPPLRPPDPSPRSAEPPAAGWYPSPSGRRYWTGREWGPYEGDAGS